MAQTYRPISEVFMYGSVAYRFYVNSFRGKVEYFAKAGKPIEDKETGEVDILPWIFDKTNRDYLAAAKIVTDKLEDLKNAAFQQKINTQAATVTTLDQQVLIADEEVQPRPIAEVTTAQDMTVSQSDDGCGLKIVSLKNKVA